MIRIIPKLSEKLKDIFLSDSVILKPLSKTIEEEANLISQKIDRCSSIRELYDVFDLIENFRASYKSTQVDCWYNSLILKYAHKELELEKY